MHKIVRTTMEQILNIMNNFSSMHDIDIMGILMATLLV